MKPNIYFLYIQKLVVLSKDLKSVLLAKRQGEADYNEVYTFIGGKMETTDDGLLGGMKREKDEEIGVDVVVGVMPDETRNVIYRKKDGDVVVLAHVPAVHISGDIELSDEYSDYKWVPLLELDAFEPKVDNILEITNWSKKKLEANKNKLVDI